MRANAERMPKDIKLIWKSNQKEKHTSRGIPARATMALPSPVHVCAEVAEKYALP